MNRVSTAVAIAFLFLAFGANAASADDDVKAGPTIAVDLNAALPVGNLADVAGPGFGLTGTFQLPLNAQIAITARAGITYHIPKDDNDALVLPALAGFRYALKPKQRSFYVSGEGGVSYVRADNMGTSVNDTGVALGLGFGYRMKSIDVRGGLQTYRVQDFGDTLSLFVTASYTVARL